MEVIHYQPFGQESSSFMVIILEEKPHYCDSWDHFGYLPEYFSVMSQQPIRGGEELNIENGMICSYPLRPELIESMMYHDTVFGNGEMIHWGRMILEQLKNTMTKVPYIYAFNLVWLCFN